jgi:hypothetical protein
LFLTICRFISEVRMANHTRQEVPILLESFELLHSCAFHPILLHIPPDPLAFMTGYESYRLWLHVSSPSTANSHLIEISIQPHEALRSLLLQQPHTLIHLNRPAMDLPFQEHATLVVLKIHCSTVLSIGAEWIQSPRSQKRSLILDREEFKALIEDIRRATAWRDHVSQVSRPHQNRKRAGVRSPCHNAHSSCDESS